MERLNPESAPHILRRGVNFALAEIEAKYQDPSNPKDYLSYHNTGHTLAVIERVKKIFSALKSFGNYDEILSADERIAIYAAGFHDIVQNSNIIDGKRKADSPQNELRSVDKALNISLRLGIFSPPEEAKIKEAILTTVPSFDPETRTVFQAALSNNSSLPALVLAISDVNSAGIDGPSVFIEEGNRLFLENNYDLFQLAIGGYEFTNKELNIFKDRLLSWSRVQVDFAKGRKLLFQKELLLFPEWSQPAIARIFNKFDVSISSATQNLYRRQNSEPKDILNEIARSILIGEPV